MKKKYVAPTISFEYYELTQSIAACDLKIGLYSSQCVQSDPDATSQMKNFAKAGYFIDRNNCNRAPVGMDGMDGICYHTNANTAFNS